MNNSEQQSFFVWASAAFACGPLSRFFQNYEAAELRKKEERKDRLYQAYLRRK